MAKTLSLVAVLLALAAGHVAARAADTPLDPVPPRLVAAARAGDWLAVRSITRPLTAPAIPVTYLRGHAALAANDPNAALCAFLTTYDEPDRRAWEAWTGELRAGSPDSASAHYLAGDALARVERFDDALAAFDQALALAPNDPLVQNARVAALAGAGRFAEAEALAEVITQRRDALADAFATRGTLALLAAPAGASGAVRWSSRALEMVPSFALALNTRGAALGALGDYDRAEADFIGAREVESCALLTTANLTVLAALRAERALAASEMLASVPGAVMRSRSTPLDRQSLSRTLEQGLKGIGDAHARAMTWGVLRDVSQARNLDGFANQFQNRQRQELAKATRLQESIVRYNFDAVKEAIRRDANGPAATSWREHGIDPQQLTLEQFRNPSRYVRSVPGGADSSAAMTHRNRRGSVLTAWLTLGYQIAWPAYRQDEELR